MKKINLMILTGTMLALTSCGSAVNEKTADTSDRSDSTGNGSVETKKPNADYKPAFKGQTRIAAIKSKTPYAGTVLSSDLKSPWGIGNLPDGRLIITEKKGTMRIATLTGTVGAPITGIPEVNDKNQGGLLGITVDPAFAQNRRIFWVFSEKLPEGNITSVARGRLSADEKKIEGATFIYRAVPAYKSSLHYGGRILFDKTGNLLVSTGERSDLETRPLAQDLNTALGKIVRITPDGKPAPGNPFAGNNNARPEIYSYGHRNVQGLAINPVTGDLWDSEFGPRGGDEINLVVPGKNYGWPTITYGIEYSGDKVGAAIQQKPGLEQPVYYWDPVISPSGITFYNSDNIPEWKNNLFVSALSGSHIIRLVIKNNKVVGEERLLEGESQRFRDIIQGKDGALYAVTDGGKLYRIYKK
ncbi:MAG: PQQ-dependent sugar dehydrogenase [Chitinophagaceae bacterium]